MLSSSTPTTRLIAGALGAIVLVLPSVCRAEPPADLTPMTPPSSPIPSRDRLAAPEPTGAPEAPLRRTNGGLIAGGVVTVLFSGLQVPAGIVTYVLANNGGCSDCRSSDKTPGFAVLGMGLAVSGGVGVLAGGTMIAFGALGTVPKVKSPAAPAVAIGPGDVSVTWRF